MFESIAARPGNSCWVLFCSSIMTSFETVYIVHVETAVGGRKKQLISAIAPSIVLFLLYWIIALTLL